VSKTAASHSTFSLWVPGIASPTKIFDLDSSIVGRRHGEGPKEAFWGGFCDLTYFYFNKR
jgi:hypothetical protein